MKVASLGNCLIQNQLSGIADHEILLVDTEKISSLIAVVRVQAECQVLCNVIFVEIDRISDNALINSLDIEQTQLCSTVLITNDINVI